jgi:hypothetical protein
MCMQKKVGWAGEIGSEGQAEGQHRWIALTAPRWQRRAADTARWRERLHRGAAVYPVEVDGTTFDLMERFAVLKMARPPLSPPLWANWCAARCKRCCGKKPLPGAQARGLVNAIGRMSADEANRTRRNGGGVVNDPQRS